MPDDKPDINDLISASLAEPEEPPGNEPAVSDKPDINDLISASLAEPEEPPENEPESFDPLSNPVFDQNPELKQKAQDALVYSTELGITPELAYDAHEQIKTMLDGNGITFENNKILERAKETPGKFIGPMDSSLMGWIKNKWRTNDEIMVTNTLSKEKAANTMALAKAFGVSPAQVADEYDFFARKSGLKGEATGEEMAVGLAETVVHMTTGTFGMIAGGLASSAALATGQPEKSPERFREISELFTYQPKSFIGQNVSEAVLLPVAALQHIAPMAGDAVMETTGSPTLGALTAIAIESIPVVAMGKGAGLSAMRSIRQSPLWKASPKKIRASVVQAVDKAFQKNPKLTEAELFKLSEAHFEKAMERRKAVKEAKAEEAVVAAEARAAGQPPVEMPNIKMPEGKLSQTATRLKEAEVHRKAKNIPPKKSLGSVKEALIDSLKRDTLLPEVQNLRYLDAVRSAKSQKKISEINDHIIDSLKIAGKRREVQQIIRDNKFQNVENLRRAKDLPPLAEMTAKDLQSYEKLLEPFQKDDVFLSQKVLERIDKTEIKGAKTIREARELYAERSKIPIEEQGPIEITNVHKFKGDSQLRNQSPYFEVMTEDYHRGQLIGEAKYYEFEKASNDLAIKARQSRKRTITEKLIPQDKLVFEYLSTPNKKAVVKKMTPAEIDYAIFLEDQFAEALAYLVENETLKTGRENYITNIRRDFFEAMKDDGVKRAMKEILDQQKQDQQSFRVMNEKTGEVLGLDKFFKFALPREGGMKPTLNVAKAANNYFKTLERKKFLDSYMPKMMAYAEALAPKTAKAGKSFFNQEIKQFTEEWINIKKGKPKKLLLEPGAGVDRALGSLKTFTTALDLGWNVSTQGAAVVGESVATYAQLGRQNMAKGQRRMLTPQGKKIIAEHKNFVDKSFLEEIRDPGKALGDKMLTALFVGFKQSAARSNRLHLLASLTEAEFKAGKITPERLSRIKLDMGETRALPGMKSIMGSSPEAKIASQYKSWALPILDTYGTILLKLGKSAFKKGDTLTPKEYNQLKNALQITTVAVAIYNLLPDDNSTFTGKALNKVKRESITIAGALDPEMFLGEPRTLGFLAEFTKASKEILTLEGYKKGQKLITPRVIKQFDTGSKGKRNIAM